MATGSSIRILENSMDRGGSWAAVYWVMKSQTQLSNTQKTTYLLLRLDLCHVLDVRSDAETWKDNPTLGLASIPLPWEDAQASLVQGERDVEKSWITQPSSTLHESEPGCSQHCPAKPSLNHRSTDTCMKWMLTVFSNGQLRYVITEHHCGYNGYK